MIKKPYEGADKSLLGIIAALLIFGVMMVYDATAVYSQDLFGGAYRFVILQIVWVVLGLLGFLFFYKHDYRKISRVAYPLFGASMLLLVILALIGFLHCSVNVAFAPCVNGANRWLYVNPAPLPKIPLLGVLGFQPSELVKLALILYLAVQLSKKQKNAFFVYFVVSALTAFLVLLQPNMSTAVLIFLVGSLMYFSSGAALRPLLVVFPLLGAIGGLAMMLSPYRRERFFTFLGNDQNGDLSIGYHIKQILIALGAGGVFGLGFGQSRQKFQYLPETSADSIFAIIGEELGFVGTTLVILAFSLLIYKGYKIAKEAPDLLGRLLAVGITSWLGIQFFVNIAAMTKLIPLTGVPIPLISYGGSSMVFSLAGLGILANINKQTKQNI